MRVGPYGGPNRRHYGALGDGAALAARLMQAAAPGQILADESVWRAAADQFTGRSPAAADPERGGPAGSGLRHYRRTAEPPRPTVTARLPPAAGGAAGRISRHWRPKLALAQAGRSQIVAVTGEAGLANPACWLKRSDWPSGGALSATAAPANPTAGTFPIYPWRPIWRGLLGLDGSLTAQAQHVEPG
jgi:adenylate cyclase